MLTPYCKGFLCKMEHENRFWIYEEKFNHLWYRYLFFQSLISVRGFAIGKTSFSQIFIPTCLLVRTIDLVLIMAPVLCNFDNLYYQNIEVIFKFIYRYFIFIKNAIELCTVPCLFKIHVLNTFPLPFNLYRFWILFTYLGIVPYQEYVTLVYVYVIPKSYIWVLISLSDGKHDHITTSLSLPIPSCLWNTSIERHFTFI